MRATNILYYYYYYWYNNVRLSSCSCTGKEFALAAVKTRDLEEYNPIERILTSHQSLKDPIPIQLMQFKSGPVMGDSKTFCIPEAKGLTIYCRKMLRVIICEDNQTHHHIFTTH